MSDLAVNDGSYQQLLDRIRECLALGRQRAFEQVNSVLVKLTGRLGGILSSLSSKVRNGQNMARSCYRCFHEI